MSTSMSKPEMVDDSDAVLGPAGIEFGRTRNAAGEVELTLVVVQDGKRRCLISLDEKSADGFAMSLLAAIVTIWPRDENRQRPTR